MLIDKGELSMKVLLLSLLEIDPESLFNKNLFPWAFKNLNCNSEWCRLLRSQKSKFWYVLCRIIRPEKLYYNFLLHFWQHKNLTQFLKYLQFPHRIDLSKKTRPYLKVKMWKLPKVVKHRSFTYFRCLLAVLVCWKTIELFMLYWWCHC